MKTATAGPPGWLLALATSASAPSALVALRGTPKQIAWAESIRRHRLASFRLRGEARVADALGLVEDATWWIANREAPLDAIRWPSPEQMSTEAAASR